MPNNGNSSHGLQPGELKKFPNLLVIFRTRYVILRDTDVNGPLRTMSDIIFRSVNFDFHFKCRTGRGFIHIVFNISLKYDIKTLL